MKNTLYYDGGCPICSKEIRLLRRFKNESLTLIDIHSDENQQSNFDKETLLSILHLQAGDGQWHKGLDATVLAWQHTWFGFVLKPLRWPILKQVSDYFYLRWATKRVCKLK